MTMQRLIARFMVFMLTTAVVMLPWIVLANEQRRP